MKIYSIFDKKAGTFAPFFYAENMNVAKRIICDFVKSSPEALPAKYSDDYRLEEMGEFLQSDTERPLYAFVERDFVNFKDILEGK